MRLQADNLCFFFVARLFRSIQKHDKILLVIRTVFAEFYGFCPHFLQSPFSLQDAEQQQVRLALVGLSRQ